MHLSYHPTSSTYPSESAEYIIIDQLVSVHIPP